MEAVVKGMGQRWRMRVRDLAGPLSVWLVWGAMTGATILFVRQYARNIPYMDDFELVSMMTGNEAVSPRWVWAQQNEHRPALSLLILAALYRLIAPDFRLGMLFNAGLISAAAASMILVVRKLRGRTSVVDIVLPLSILNIGQAETLLISFALNLILTSWISCKLIGLAAVADPRVGWRFALKFGVVLVFLPLCGGSGLVLLPPLILWFGGYSIWGWWSGCDPGRVPRSVGLALTAACLAIVVLYMIGYVKPAHHRPAPSLAAAGATTLEYFSLVVCPNVPNSWRIAGIFTMVLIAVTLVRLATVALRRPDERPRALAIGAVIVSMVIAAVAVGLSRSFLGPKAGMASRYVTTAAPLLCALYVAWLVVGPSRARRVVHVGLLVLTCIAIPANAQFGVRFGEDRRSVFRKLEYRLKARARASVVMSVACPALYPRPNKAYECFKMLKDARIGDFKYFMDGRVAPEVDAEPVLQKSASSPEQVRAEKR